MEVISSSKNAVVQEIAKIKKNHSALFLEGERLVQEAINNNCQPSRTFVQKDKLEYFSQKFPTLINDKTYILTPNVFEKICDTKTPQGIAVVVDFKFKTPFVPRNNFLVVENVQDPGNLGTILRCAKGTDFCDVFLVNCVNVFNTKVVRSSMGGIFGTNICQMSSTDEFLDFARENNLQLAVLAMDGKNIFEIKKKPQKIGLVLGNEGNGVTENMRIYAQDKWSVPMKHNLESLNVSVCAGICMFYLDNLM